jgi:GT2 family glycosyltransferase
LTTIVPATNRPPTLNRCLAAIRDAAEPPEELIVVEHPENGGPALARNLGARQASGEVLVFVDADVEVHPDVFQRFRARFDGDTALAAVFGSYDDRPAAPGIVSAFRNLLHHHVHQASAGVATTFWAGLGALRRDQFLSVAGFDHRRFALPSIEDIELGLRLTARGERIELDPAIQGTHLKRWTLGEMIRTDILRRGAPWIALLLSTPSHSTALNLGWRHRLSALSIVAAGSLLIGRRPRAAVTAASLFVVLNAPFYFLVLRKRGVSIAAASIPLHALHHLAGAVAVPMGVLLFFRWRGEQARGALLELESPVGEL